MFKIFDSSLKFTTFLFLLFTPLLQGITCINCQQFEAHPLTLGAEKQLSRAKAATDRTTSIWADGVKPSPLCSICATNFLVQAHKQKTLDLICNPANIVFFDDPNLELLAEQMQFEPDSHFFILKTTLTALSSKLFAKNLAQHHPADGIIIVDKLTDEEAVGTHRFGSRYNFKCWQFLEFYKKLSPAELKAIESQETPEKIKHQDEYNFYLNHCAIHKKKLKDISLVKQEFEDYFAGNPPYKIAVSINMTPFINGAINALMLTLVHNPDFYTTFSPENINDFRLLNGFKDTVILYEDSFMTKHAPTEEALDKGDCYKTSVPYSYPAEIPYQLGSKFYDLNKNEALDLSGHRISRACDGDGHDLQITHTKINSMPIYIGSIPSIFEIPWNNL